MPAVPPRLAAPAALLLSALFSAAPAEAAGKAVLAEPMDVVQPTPGLAAFIERFRADLSKGPKARKAIERHFATSVAAFTRGLDPTKPWHRLDPFTSAYIANGADIMIEQAEMVSTGSEPAPVPDYGGQMIELLLSLTAPGTLYGKMPEVPGQVCAPAVWGVNDGKALAAFARKTDTEVGSMRFATAAIPLLKKPREGAKVAGILEPLTLAAFEYDKNAGDGWQKFVGSNGVTGYTRSDADWLYFSASHVCFGEVKGEWRVTALFGYGL